MSLKRKLTVIKLAQEERKEFQDWALGKNNSPNGISKAKKALRLAQNNSQSQYNIDSVEVIKLKVKTGDRSLASLTSASILRRGDHSPLRYPIRGQD